MRTYYAVGLCLILILMAGSGPSSAAISPERLQGENFSLYSRPFPANEMTLQDLRGKTFSLSSLRGKVVLLNFWKVDCVPCAMEKPVLERIYRKYGGRGLAIVAVNLFDEYNRIRAYKGKGGYNFTFAFDPGKLFRVQSQTLASGMVTNFVVNPGSEAIYEIAGVPTTYVIDRNGRIVGHGVGMINWEKRPMREFLESLLGKPPRQTIASRPRAAGPRAQRTPGSAGPTAGKPQPPSSRKSLTNGPKRVSSNPKKQPTLPFQSVDKPASPDRKLPETMPAPQAPAPAGPKSVGRARPQLPSRSQLARNNPKPAAPKRRPRPSHSPAGSPKRREANFSRPAQQAPAGRMVPPSRDFRRPSGSALPPAEPSPSTVGSQPSSSLPAALPYVPARSRTYSPPRAPSRGRGRAERPTRVVTPDKNGYVSARIPAPDGGFARERRPAPRAPMTGRGFPPPASIGGANPFSGFVLDSFRQTPTRLSPRSRGGQSMAPDRSGPSLFGSLGRIGSGVMDVFSRLNPIR